MNEKKKPEGAVQCRRCGCCDLILRDKIPLTQKRIQYIRECRHCGAEVRTVVKIDATSGDSK